MKRGFLLLILVPAILFGRQSNFQDLKIFGNRHTRPQVILQEMNFKPGQPLSSAFLLAERAWLLRQHLFKRIEFQVQPGINDSTRLVLMIVQEQGRFSINPIVSNNDLFGWYGGFKLTARNLTGFNTRLSTLIQLGGIQRIALNFTQPWMGGKARLFFTCEIGHLKRPYLYHDYKTPFNFQENNLIISLGKSFNRHLKMGLKANFFSITTSDRQITTNSQLWENGSIAGGFLHYDSRDWPLYPRTGLLADLSIDWTTFARHNQYRQIYLDFRGYIPHLHQNIIALQTRLSISSSPLPVYRRLHIGGGHTVRGTRTGAMAGDNIFLAGLEYRFPIVYERSPLAGLHAGWAGVLFVDTGTAWYHAQSPLKTALLFSAGCGIHLIWDNFVLRFEYGNRGKGWGFITAGSGIKF